MEKIIVLYSHENEKYRPQIERHLQALESYGIKFWNDLEDFLPDFKDANAVIIMLSSHFIASEIIRNKVIPKIFQQMESNFDLKLFPILVEPCSTKFVTWLRGIPVLPEDGPALSKVSENERDQIIVDFLEQMYPGLSDIDLEPKKFESYCLAGKILTNTHHFEDFRKGDFIYIDKTKFIHQLLNENMSQCFLSRPRRFGKSLLITMMKELFLGNKRLFKGLYIYDKYDFKPYPVIHLPLASLQYDRNLSVEKATIKAFTDIFSEIAEEYQIPRPEGAYLGKLVKNLNAKYNSQAIVLIDEYDKPLLRYLNDKENREIVRSIMRDIFSPLKDLTSKMKLLFITGVSKFSKVSIFSDLNNLDDLTMLSRYSTIAGFTQQDVEHYFKDYINALAKEENKSSKKILEEIKLWYNGYSWDGKSFVYAPYSISKLFKHLEFKNYWFTSATPSFLIDVIKEFKQGTLTFNDFDSYEMISDDMEKYDIGNIRLLPFLFQSGYLSVYDIERSVIKIGFPNMEVRYSFFQYLFEEFSIRNPKYFNRLSKAIDKANIDEIMEYLKSILATIPYQILEKKERVYHSHVYTVLRTINENTFSEVSTNLGRIDTVMETKDAIFIFEFKMKSAEDGLSQIKTKKYAEGYLNKKKDIFLIGVKFSEKDRNIDDFKYEILKS